MALPLGKLTILVGAGILGSVLAKEGRLSNVSDLVSGAFKIAFKQINQDDSSSSIGKPHNDSLMAQVNCLRQELQMLASNRSVTIVTASGTSLGASKYGLIVVVGVAGYGYVWWKGWKLPDMMFATRRSLSDACTTIAGQLENVYASIRSTRRQLSSNIDRVDSNLNEVAVLTATTQEKVTELLEDSERIGHDVRYVRDAVETLEIKISRIEGKQDMTNLGVKKLVDYAYNLENKLLEENTQASSSSSRIAFSSERGSLLLPPSEPTSLSISIGSLEVQRPLHRAASATPPQRTNGISEAVEVSSNLGISNGFRALEETNNGSSRWIKPTRIMRTCSATNAVVPQTSSIRQQF
ncbi:uncharacterized protein LOC110629626 isoform X1 [Manihot esculenta]|uniref:DUF1664 domain-containing protein n=3 Tax=Manihot esculenta TaxID=3983 RepID=A0A2C9UMT4_MANES|nr:uncharacterized protein LOC110629626 isoform X1 [Manihot esculenta]OAY32319.1 hypothetical protein MANES_13G009200v8 [Manihot esculenta]